MNSIDKDVNDKRRKLLTAATTLSMLHGLGLVTSSAPATAANRTLNILRWKHLVPAVETWFNEVFVNQWSEKNNITVNVDSVGLSEIDRIANAEALRGYGHDLVEFVGPRADLAAHVIDHGELYEHCEHLYGSAIDLSHMTCFNPRTKQYHGFCTNYSPPMLTYRHDLWKAVGVTPSSWEAVRKGGRAIKLLHDVTQGISLSGDHNAQHGLRAIMAAFGSSVQNADGYPSLSSPATLEALKFTKAMYNESMPRDVLSWQPPSNNQYMLSGGGSLTIDVISIIRAAESKNLPVNEHLSLTTLPEGPAGNSTPAYGSNTWCIWRFAKNIDAAKQFLIDYVSESRAIFLKSGFQEMPSFPGTVPDISSLIENSQSPPQRYAALNHVTELTTNFGYPGFSNAAIGEIQQNNIVTRMFAQAATGQITPEQSMQQAFNATRPIFDRWRAAGKL